MTGPDAWPDEQPDRLTEAIHAYGRRFPRRGLPFLRPAGDPEGREVAIRLLTRAVATGRPLDGWAIARALGLRKPPEGACW